MTTDLDPQDCTCEYLRQWVLGTHDTVTGKWLPDKPTQHIQRVSDLNCPFHRGA